MFQIPTNFKILYSKFLHLKFLYSKFLRPKFIYLFQVRTLQNPISQVPTIQNPISQVPTIQNSKSQDPTLQIPISQVPILQIPISQDFHIYTPNFYIPSSSRSTFEFLKFCIQNSGTLNFYISTSYNPYPYILPCHRQNVQIHTLQVPTP